MLFFLILAVTGLILNHGAGLGLDGRYVHAGWLARWRNGARLNSS